MDRGDEDPETTKEVEALKKSMNLLFAKLDTLTHFHYTPKNLSAEVKVIKNMPSIAVEEVAPVVASDATLLAPQEVADAKRGKLYTMSILRSFLLQTNIVYYHLLKTGLILSYIARKLVKFLNISMPNVAFFEKLKILYVPTNANL